MSEYTEIFVGGKITPSGRHVDYISEPGTDTIECVEDIQWMPFDDWLLEFNPHHDPRDGRFTSGCITNVNEASEAIADEVTAWINALAAQGRMPAAEPPDRAEIAENWKKVFRARKTNEGNKAAFVDLNPELRAELNRAIAQNRKNDRFQEYVSRHGDAPVIFRRQERGSSAAAEWRGGIHVYDSPFWKGETEAPITEPNKATMGGVGGYAAVIRHEYGHKLADLAPPEAMRDFNDSLPDFDQRGKDLTSYAMKNNGETFAELFALVTDPRYNPKDFAPWIESAHQKIRAMLL